MESLRGVRSNVMSEKQHGRVREQCWYCGWEVGGGGWVLSVTRASSTEEFGGGDVQTSHLQVVIVDTPGSVSEAKPTQQTRGIWEVV